MALSQVPWLQQLAPGDRERAAGAISMTEVAPGQTVCRIGTAPRHWLGVIDGLLEMTTESAEGDRVTYTGLSPGGWFGEGTILKRERYRYSVQALRHSHVARLPVGTFDWLLDHSIAFNRFVMRQLNARLAQFIGMMEAERSPSPEQRVARTVAALVNPELFPNVGSVLRITQHELASLAGLSRQRVNRALQVLQAEQLLQVEYGTLHIPELTPLLRYSA